MPIFILWSICSERSFHMVTPVFLINVEAILSLAIGTRKDPAYLVAYWCTWLFVTKNELKMFGKRLFLYLYTKSSTENLYNSGSLRRFSLTKASLVLSLYLIFSIILIALFCALNMGHSRLFAALPQMTLQ